MRRLLLGCCVLGSALALLPAAAPAAPWTRDVRADVRNSTEQQITLGFYDDGKYRQIAIAPGRTAEDVTQNDSDMVVSLEDCGPARLRLGNPTFGPPVVTLTATNFGLSASDQDSFDVDERHTERFQGVRIVSVRRDDTAKFKNFDIDVQACRATPSDTMTPVPEQTTGILSARYVRATIRNATADPVDIGYEDADDRWRAVTVAPGATTPAFGTNSTQLTLVLSDCGPARLRFTNQLVLAPSVSMWGERWTAPGSDLDVDEATTFTHDDVRVKVTRDDDSAASKRFSVELLSC